MGASPPSLSEKRMDPSKFMKNPAFAAISPAGFLAAKYGNNPAVAAISPAALVANKAIGAISPGSGTSPKPRRVMDLDKDKDAAAQQRIMPTLGSGGRSPGGF